MSLSFDLPANLNGDALEAELAEAGVPGGVVAHGDTLIVTGPTDADRPLVEQVVAAHQPPAAPDLDAEFRQAVQSATTLTDLKAALLGSRGPGAQPRRR